MATDGILKEILLALRRLEKASDDIPHYSSSVPRPTEQFPKIELAIERAIAAHSRECAISMREKWEDKISPLLEKVFVLERQLLDMRKELGGKINGVKEDAAKTAQVTE